MKNIKTQDGLFYWTKHAQEKLRQYGLSPSRVKRLIRHPQRTEVGIAPETWASMQTAGSKKHPYEIWVMYVIENSKFKSPACLAPACLRVTEGKSGRSQGEAGRQKSKLNPKLSSRVKLLSSRKVESPSEISLKTIKIISAWKYPGVTQPGEPIPIPPDIFEEIIKNYL